MIPVIFLWVNGSPDRLLMEYLFLSTWTVMPRCNLRFYSPPVTAPFLYRLFGKTGLFIAGRKAPYICHFNRFSTVFFTWECFFICVMAPKKSAPFTRAYVIGGNALQIVSSPKPYIYNAYKKGELFACPLALW